MSRVFIEMEMPEMRKKEKKNIYTYTVHILKNCE